uniref:Uncharacterized protein n=1 Tax=viral metagenome TaxID=1070528 RepID=A0A6M3M8I2_9ZZZZ
MEYVWKGDNKLCIPGMGKIIPGGSVDLDERTLKIPGVVKLIADGMLGVKEQPAAPEEVPQEETPVAEPEVPASEMSGRPKPKGSRR